MRIEILGLTKRFGSVTAVNGLSFTVEPGVITGFFGPNGAGKTTTLRILLGLVQADAGSATIGGTVYSKLPTPSDHVGAVLDATGAVTDPQIDISRAPDAVTVEVSGVAPQVVPGLGLRVAASATGPVERFVAEPDRP